MARIKVAHLRQQGVDLIITPLDSSFGQKQSSEQNNIVGGIQARASSAGLRGTVVPVWDGGGGRMSFIAPRNWHAFFLSISLSFVWANVNRELSW